MNPDSPRVCIIITTRNRAEHLRETLASIRDLSIPAELATELIIVDNGSTDATQEVCRKFRTDNIPVRYITEPRVGQCHARNTGIASANCEIIVFTDDDVRVSKGWVSELTSPLIAGKYDAVVGAVSIAPNLQRGWMTSKHKAFLASTEVLNMSDPPQLIGANMAFLTRVLKVVPEFDYELGPGAKGFGDETLFSWQLKRAGFRLGGCAAAGVEHHFDRSRLLRRHLLATSVRMGQTAVYLDYHWRHITPKGELRRWMRAELKLLIYRAKRGHQELDSEGCDEVEMKLTTNASQHRQWRHERRRARNYDQYGLVRIDRKSSKNMGKRVVANFGSNG